MSVPTRANSYTSKEQPRVEKVVDALRYIPLHDFDRKKQQAITAALVNNGLEEVALENLRLFKSEKTSRERIRDAKKMKANNLWPIVNEAKKHGFVLKSGKNQPLTEPKRVKKDESEEQKRRTQGFYKWLDEHNRLPNFEPTEDSYLHKKLSDRLITAMSAGMTQSIKQGRGFISYRIGEGCIQRIYDKKTKGFPQKPIRSLPEQYSGSYLLIGQHYNGGTIYLSESLATGLSVALTGRVVAVCLSHTNFEAATNQLRSDFPNARLVVAADNDKNKSGENAAIKTGLPYTMPENVGEDWNDVLQRGGLTLVRDGMERLRFNGSFAVNERYIGQESNFEIQQGSINVLKSTMGTGKTVLIKKCVKNSGKKTVIVCKLRSLTRSIAGSLGAMLYEDFKGCPDLEKMLKQADVIAITPESLHMLDGVIPEIFVIDESEQTLKYWTNTETMKGQNKPNLDRLRFMAEKAETVILADAHAGVATNLFIEATKGSGDLEKPVVRYTNLFRHEGRTAKQISSHGEAYDMVRADLQAGEKLFVPCTSRADAKKIHSLCEGMGKNSVVIHGENSGNPEIQDFIKQVNDGRCHNVDALIVSPAAGTGLSVDNHSFTKTIGIFQVVKGVTVNDAVQMLNRVRNVSDYAVFAGNNNSGFEECPNTIEQLIRNRTEETVSESGFNGQVQYCELLLKLDCLTKSEVNKSANNFNSLFWDSMLNDGYTLSFTGKDESAEENGKKIKSDIKKLADAEIENALQSVDILTEEQFSKADKGSIAAVKTLCHKLLPEYEGLDELTLKAAKNPRLIYRVKYYYDLATMSLKDARNADKEGLSEFKGFHGELKHAALQKKKMGRIFRFAGIDPVTFEHDGKTWTSSNDDQKKAIFRIIGKCHETTKDPVKWLNNQLEKYGFSVSYETVKTGETTTKIYTIKGKNLLRELRLCDPPKSSGF